MGVPPRPCGRHRAGPWIKRAPIVVLLLVLFTGARAETGAQRWLLVDTAQSSLTVIDGDRPQLTLHNLAIGRYGTSRSKQRGDNKTPLGRFRITRIDRDTSFHRFLGLDYPDAERARRGLYAELISGAQYRAILAAHRDGRTPPQDTPLGGHIGIHGVGQGDARLHEMANWTQGCVALSNEQIDTLLSWVRVGMAVEIR